MIKPLIKFKLVLLINFLLVVNSHKPNTGAELAIQEPFLVVRIIMLKSIVLS